MRLIFVHGRAQGGKNPDALKQEWENALEKGLQAAGLAWPDGVTTELPFYGDTLDDLLHQLDTPLVEEVKTRGGAADPDEASFRGELLSELAEGAGIADDEIQQEFAGQPHERGVLNWEWVHSILKALDRTSLGGKAIDSFTRDVYAYLCNKAVRRRIDAIVQAAFADGSCVVVGHSLGTVVGYNVLRGRDGMSQVRRYVTVGSPLGIKSIKKRLDTPLRMPACVSSWNNALDERDVVALNPLDSSNFPITPEILNKRDVSNHTNNRHGIVGYLDDPVVAGWIHEALTA